VSHCRRLRADADVYLVPRCFSQAHGSGNGDSATDEVSCTDFAGRGCESAKIGARRGEAARAAAMSNSGGALSALACTHEGRLTFGMTAWFARERR